MFETPERKLIMAFVPVTIGQRRPLVLTASKQQAPD